MVWRSDGTATGTYQLRDMGADFFMMGNFMEPVNGSICFMAGRINQANFANSTAVLFKPTEPLPEQFLCTTLAFIIITFILLTLFWITHCTFQHLKALTVKNSGKQTVLPRAPF